VNDPSNPRDRPRFTPGNAPRCDGLAFIPLRATPLRSSLPPQGGHGYERKRLHSFGRFTPNDALYEHNLRDGCAADHSDPEDTGNGHSEGTRRVRNLAQVQGAIALCHTTPGCSPSVGLTAQIPQVGSISQGAYVFTYWADGSGNWTYTAVAQGSVFSPTGNDYWTDTSGVAHCGDWPGGAPC
jgi:hypothetical protein